MQINGKDHKFWDGGMCENPKIPEGGFTVLATFKKEKENLKSKICKCLEISGRVR